MHALSFLYPAGSQPFDAVHWKEVHLPLGLGLTDKHLGIRPDRIMLFHAIRGGDLQDASAPYGAIATCIFSDKEQVEAFSTLFEFEEAARRLSEDFPNYTAGPPNVMVCEIRDVTDIDAMIEQFQADEAGRQNDR